MLLNTLHMVQQSSGVASSFGTQILFHYKFKLIMLLLQHLLHKFLLPKYLLFVQFLSISATVILCDIP